MVVVSKGGIAVAVVIVSIVVDAREVRLHKDYFKDICSTLDVSR